ncbi:hypothetical protein BDA99DRAFT_505031 [Phascolomyces articulosus]|uniref:Uncharacterized protein n=1 Tax=Phascolomyces articulosus TaxID=60185 RepID=A0AAD5KE63_9FUNG|nr:hypothetical protein BDA99DRAFT_505031 [Phascolomyces articulosus]
MKTPIFSATAATLAFLAASIGSQVVQAKTAIDTFELVSSEAYKCAHGEQGYEGAAIGCYREGNSLSECPTNYFRARSAGFKDVDLSLRPCAHRGCTKTPREQVDEFTSFANTNKMGYRYLWLYVSTSDNWGSSPPEGNQATLNDFKEALDAASSTTLWKWGIATSASDWKTITGPNDWELDNTVPLWYENHDGQPNFDEYTPFGGWETPFAKQYAKDSDVCGVRFSQSYYIE